MEARLEKVEELMLAAWQAMQPVSESCTADEVINALLNFSSRAVDIVIKMGGRREPVQAFFQLQILKLTESTDLPANKVN